ncbi:MAG: single-stranded-DNA-specific exonuclease RecJ, partial [Methylobacteriaceae bacterium]|nr:single-stranded-DNA-specific exonuclease RecJ [Methylobacteriaceae bacterium]
NRERQAIEQAAVEEALARAGILVEATPDLAAIVLDGPDWHPGIVGLVAARVTERHGRPTFAFATRPDGTITGSGRSVRGVDLGRAVRAAVACGDALKGGGHAMAAGATLTAEGLARFRACLARELAAEAGAGCAGADDLLVDGILAAGGADAALVRALDGAGPFGSGQPEPVFALRAHRVCDVRPVGTGHLRVQLKAPDGAGLKAVAFRSADAPLGRMLTEVAGGTLHLAGTLSIDRWGGGERAELRILDAAPATP